MNKKKLVVIGGGAAGFFCAVNAARLNPELQVVIVEKTSRLLAKVKVSGGGRCNVTHACFNIPAMLSNYPRGAGFLKKAFHHFLTTDTIEWFRERGVPLKTEADGRMFPESNTSQSIIDCLLTEANTYRVEIMMNAEVCDINSIESAAKKFSLTIKNGKQIEADYLCIACGGFPKTAQYEWLRSTGHTIETPVPSLFTFNMPGNDISSLMGITVQEVIVKIMGSKLSQSGSLLITHWGFSGPVILKLSAWAARELAVRQYEFSIVVNWLPAYNENTLKEKLQQVRFDIAAQKIVNRNPFLLPARLWEYLVKKCEIPEEMRWADLPAKAQHKLVKLLCTYECLVKGKTTFKEEFVTSGGINTDEINVNDMQSKIVPGLYFAGEIINVDGVTGGFNFQNAWTTGWIAAKGIMN